MNYKIDKESFYQLLEKLINDFYGDDYVKSKKVLGSDTVNVHGIWHDCTCESYFLHTKDYIRIFENGRNILVQPINKKLSFGITSKNDNTYFSYDEMVETLSKNIFQFPFLDILPIIISEICIQKEDDEIVFNEEITCMISDIILRYAKKHQMIEDDALINLSEKIRERKQESN